MIEGPAPYRLERSFPIVMDGGASRETLACACRSTEPGGHCTHVGILYEPETAHEARFHAGRLSA